MRYRLPGICGLLPATLLLGTALCATAAPVPVPDPDPRALAYYQSGNLLWVLVTLWSLLLPFTLFLTGISAWIRDHAERLSFGPIRRTALYLSLYTLVVFLASRPLAYILGYLRPHAFGLSNQDLTRWLTLGVKALGVKLLVMVVAGSLLYWVLRRFPRRWWLLAALGTIPLAFLMMEVWPVWVEPLFHDFGRLEDARLEGRILELARRCGVEAEQVYEVDMSRDTKMTNAYVAGLWGSKRIVLWDTLVAKLGEDEVVFIMAHELGHYVLDHMMQGFVLTCLALPLFFYLLHRLSGALLPRLAARSRVRELADPASFPLILTIGLALAAMSDPVSLAISRQVEHQADVFALELTRMNEAGARAFAKLQTDNLSNPRPGWLHVLLRASHPSLGDRIDFCNRYRPWEEGKPLRYGERIPDGPGPESSRER